MNWFEVHAAIDHARERQQTWEREAHLSRIAKSLREHQAQAQTLQSARQGIDRTLHMLGNLLKTPTTRTR